MPWYLVDRISLESVHEAVLIVTGYFCSKDSIANQRGTPICPFTRQPLKILDQDKFYIRYEPFDKLLSQYIENRDKYVPNHLLLEETSKSAKANARGWLNESLVHIGTIPELQSDIIGHLMQFCLEKVRASMTVMKIISRLLIILI